AEDGIRDFHVTGVQTCALPIFIALGIGAIALADRFDGSLAPLATIAVGLAVLGSVLWFDRRAPVPLLPRQASNPWSVIGAGYLAIFALTAASMPFNIYVPPLLQQALGLTPLEAGYVVGASALSGTLAGFAVARVPDGRERRPIVRGASRIAGGVALQALVVPAMAPAAVVGAGVVMGLGFGLSSSLINRRAIIHLTAEEEAIGSAALMTMRQVGGALGAALAGVAANRAGFGEGLTDATAVATANTVFLAARPIALLGLTAAAVMTRRAAP